MDYNVETSDGVRVMVKSAKWPEKCIFSDMGKDKLVRVDDVLRLENITARQYLDIYHRLKCGSWVLTLLDQGFDYLIALLQAADYVGYEQAYLELVQLRDALHPAYVQKKIELYSNCVLFETLIPQNDNLAYLILPYLSKNPAKRHAAILSRRLHCPTSINPYTLVDKAKNGTLCLDDVVQLASYLFIDDKWKDNAERYIDQVIMLCEASTDFTHLKAFNYVVAHLCVTSRDHPTFFRNNVNYQQCKDIMTTLFVTAIRKWFYPGMPDNQGHDLRPYVCKINY
jgi:hypothetical protein